MQWLKLLCFWCLLVTLLFWICFLHTIFKKKILCGSKVGPIVITKAMNLFIWKPSSWDMEAKPLAMFVSYISNSWNTDLGLFTVSTNHLKKKNALIIPIPIKINNENQPKRTESYTNLAVTIVCKKLFNYICCMDVFTVDMYLALLSLLS